MEHGSITILSLVLFKKISVQIQEKAKILAKVFWKVSNDENQSPGFFWWDRRREGIPLKKIVRA